MVACLNHQRRFESYVIVNDSGRSCLHTPALHFTNCMWQSRRAHLKLDGSCPQHRECGSLVAVDNVLGADRQRPPVHPLHMLPTKCLHLEHTL